MRPAGDYFFIQLSNTRVVQKIRSSNTDNIHTFRIREYPGANIDKSKYQDCMKTVFSV